jgi:hypothetical protein
VKLPVKWRTIEIYSPFRTEDWDLALPVHWAEQEVLLFASLHNAREATFREIDPLSGARRYFAELLASFDDALATAEREEDLQKFLTANPLILEHGFKSFWPKLPFGERLVSDFGFEGGSGDYLLVELENPKQPLFTKNGTQSAPLTHAIDQTVDWCRYIQDNLGTVRTELGLTRITPMPRRLIVIGRASTLNERLRRKLATQEGLVSNLKILTYDDLRQQTKQAFENMVGPLDEQPGQTEIYYPVKKIIVPG